MNARSMIRAVCAAVLLTLASVPATAQSGQSATVVVTGRRVPAATVIHRLTRSISRAASVRQLARFPGAICPLSVGLPDEYARKLEAQIASDARAAGVPVDGAGCRANIIILIVEHGQAVLKAIHRQHPAALRGVEADEVRRVLAAAGPVHVLTLTEVRDRDGGHESRIPPAGMQGGQADARYLEIHSASMLNLPTRLDINGSLVVFDADATVGKTIRQLADYAAMRTLARTQTGSVAPGDDTILTLFADDGTAAPPGLTGFDAAYLKALYHGSDNQPALAKVASMATSISRSAAPPSP